MANVTIKQSNLNGGVLGDLSRQWFSRPDDERITGKDSMDARLNIEKIATQFYMNSRNQIINTHAITVIPWEEQGLVLQGSKGVAAPSYWAMTQLCQRAGVPAGYVRGSLATNPKLAAECLNYGLRQREDDRVALLLTKKDETAIQFAACTGPTYGRIWNKDILHAVNKVLDDKWTVPGIFGQPVSTITKENTSLFISAQDMFIGLSDETRKIEIPNRRDGKPGMLSRGVLIGNSETGAGVLTIKGFLFDYACFNRNFWGVEDITEIRIRHTSGAPERFLMEARPAIQKFLNAGTSKTLKILEAARSHKIADPLDFLGKKFTRPAAQAIIEIHKEEEHRPIENLWDANVGATAYARTLSFQDERVRIETIAGEMMPKMAA